MAISQQVYDISMKTATDLSDKQFYWMQVSADYTVALATAADTELVGLLQNKPESGVAAQVRRVGISKAVLGGTVTAGSRLTSDANGKTVAATSGQRYGAIALEGGDSGDTISVLMEFGTVA